MKISLDWLSDYVDIDKSADEISQILSDLGFPTEGKKSVTVSLRFRDEDGTLRHDVVDEFEKQILSDLTAALGAELRTV